jgi:hypothetical protein
MIRFLPVVFAPNDLQGVTAIAHRSRSYPERGMEPLWSPVVATRGNQPQTHRAQKGLELAHRCHDENGLSESAARQPHQRPCVDSELDGS